MNFASDNVHGVHPRILEAIVAANAVPTDVPYGHDDGARLAEEALSHVFEREVRAFLVLNGTMANALALSTLVPPWGAVFCHEGAHIQTDECNAPELVMGGAKLLALPGAGHKLTPEAIAQRLAHFNHGEHGPRPSAISITQATEMGTVYALDEIAALGDLSRERGLRLHMDGARFANALVSLACTPAEMTWKAGVDVLSFGGTKNGGMILEAVVCFDPSLADDFLRRRKRAGQLLSKGRYLSAQVLAYLQDGLWLDCARHANAMACRLGEGMATVPGVRLAHPVQANEVFAVIPKGMYDTLLARGAHFYDWPMDGLAPDEVLVRWVTAWATPPASVDRLIEWAHAGPLTPDRAPDPLRGGAQRAATTRLRPEDLAS